MLGHLTHSFGGEVDCSFRQAVDFAYARLGGGRESHLLWIRLGFLDKVVGTGTHLSR